MRRNSYALAALASAGIPGVIPVSTVLTSPKEDEIDTAVVRDDQNRYWVVTAAATPSAGARVAKEIGVLEALAGTELAPYVQSPQGYASMPEGGRAAIALALEGTQLRLDEVSHDHDLAADLGRLLATIHNTPAYATEQALVEEFTPRQMREQFHANIERASAKYMIPAAVAQRWKLLLADHSLWQFTPRFIHGSLSEEHTLAIGSSISGFTGWENAMVGDPARDLTWLFHGLDALAFEAFFTAYTAHADIRPDSKLQERTQLVGEFAVLEWLLSGDDIGDEHIVNEALEMLQEVDDDLSELAKAEAEHDFDELEGESGPTTSQGIKR